MEEPELSTFRLPVMKVGGQMELRREVKLNAEPPPLSVGSMGTLVLAFGIPPAEGGRRLAVEGRRSVEPMLEWRRVGKDPTERQVAGDKWMLEEGAGRPRAPRPSMDPAPLPPPMALLSESRRPARD